MQERLDKIVKVLDDNKAQNIEIYDLSSKSYIAQMVIIASSLGAKHTLALLDHLKKELKRDEDFLRVEQSDSWIVVDLGDILIHLMTPEYRTKYDMEGFLNSVLLGK
ncbi:MAG: ribosome silencing factor [Sulfurimonas sp.]|nr:ribosome silencing factor [Sulfurimonadaceae bacterium]